MDDLRALLQDLVEVVTQDVEIQSDRLVELIRLAKRALAGVEEQHGGERPSGGL